MSIRALHRPLSGFTAALLVLVALLAAPSPGALAEGDKDEKISERAEIDRELEDLRLELGGVQDELADTYLALAETELQIPQAQQALDEARAELAEAREEDRLTGDRLEAAEDEEAKLSGAVEEGQEEVDRSDGELAQVAITAYKGGGLPSPATVYAGGQSPQDTVDRSMNYRLTMASQGARLDTLREDQAVTENSSDRLTAVREEIDDLKTKAEEAVQRTEDSEAAATQAKRDLDDLYAQQQSQRDDLEAKKSQYQEDESTLESRSSVLDEEIAELARQEREREERERKEREREERERQEREASQSRPAPQSGGGGGGGGGSSSSTSGSGWALPIDMRMNSNFGWRTHPIWGTRRLHAGVDFPAACGVGVKATQSGRVIARTHNSGAGNKLILSHGIHNGKLMTSSYHHLQGFAVPVGASISAGQTVAYVGSTGGSTGCHLHFEIHEDGSAVNPNNYV